MPYPRTSGKRVKTPHCPKCGDAMELSDSPVMLVEQGDQADPPVWLCRRCWIILPLKHEHLHTVSLAA